MAGCELSRLARLVGPGQLEIDRGAQLRNGSAHLLAARGRLAQPERHRRRLALSVGDAHRAVADAQDAPRGIAELEHVTRQRFDREVLVQRAEEMALGLEQHAVVEDLRNRSAVHDRVESRAFAASEFLVETVVVNQRTASAATRRVAAREHFHDFHELGLFERRGRDRRRLKSCEQRVFVPLLFGRRLGHDLLRQHVERLVRHRDAIELAVMHRAHHRRALDQVVAREREDASLGHALDGVARAPDALQEGGDAVRRGDLADQVDMADVDAELERRGRHQDFQLPLSQPVLSIQARFLGEAAVVRGHVLGAEALGELVRHALRQPARVDGDERGAVRLDQADQAVVDLLPDLVRHHRFERRAGDLDGEVELPLVAFVDDRTRSAGQKARDFIDRLLRRRKPMRCSLRPHT